MIARGPHTPAIIFQPMGTATCHEPGWWPDIGWMCWHEEHCATCGDVLRRFISESECPDWPGHDTGQRITEPTRPES